MENSLKKTLGVAVCILFTLFAYLYLCMVVTPKDIGDSGGSLYYRGMGFLSEEENSIDVMIYGNSDVYSGIIPARIFQDHGYTSYASGRANQTMGEIVSLLNRTLTDQKPKVAILETDCFFTKNKTVNMATDNLLTAPFLYHSRWKELSGRDFVTIPNRREMVDSNRGFLPSKLSFNAESYGDYMKDQRKKPAKIPEQNRKAIETFVKTCKEKVVQVVFLELPSPSSWNYRKHQAVAAIAEEHQVDFLDLNLPQKDYEVDLRHDFRDNGNHMNTVGADRATVFLGGYLKDHYGDVLRDQRKDTGMRHWDKGVENYKKLMKSNGK